MAVTSTSRRDFLKATAVTGTALAANLGALANVHAGGSDTIRVGLVGCGGRGSGAAEDVLKAAPNVKLVALGDVFEDRLQGLRKRISATAANDERIKKLGNAVEVSDERCFVGFDAYDKVIQSCDYVMLATPPGFRPLHIAATVAAGKNLFSEKPVATDAPGIRKVLAAYEEAKKKNLHIVTGTQRRHQDGYLEAMKRIHDGAIGQITSGRCYWNQGPIWAHKRQPGWNDMQYMIRNWYHFTWLCGDHIVEQHVHNLDAINWALGAHPVRAVGMGGRQAQTGEEFGESYDHFAIDYEYPHGVHVLSMARQIAGCEDDISEAVAGTQGRCTFKNGYHITGPNKWSGHDQGENPYVQEHTDLIEAIRKDQPINELKNVAESTLTAIMGRMSAYTGKAVKWEQALNSKEDLFPPQVSWNTSMPELRIPVPGKTPFV
jgi:predicted dehydrogenase